MTGLPQLLHDDKKIACAAISRRHMIVTCQATAALTLLRSQRSPAASSIHRDRPPKRDLSGSREGCDA